MNIFPDCYYYHVFTRECQIETAQQICLTIILAFGMFLLIWYFVNKYDDNLGRKK